jgi:AcrR family transcriptional regulator
MTPRRARRPYRKRKRALAEEATRRRITEAAVELHASIGPARTTVTEIAERAGVSRMTVYKHFPTDRDVFVACSTHWAERNPSPEPSAWGAIADPLERLSIALRELYAWYEEKDDMLGKVFRDEPTLPSLAAVMSAQWAPYLEAIVGTLAEGWTTGQANDAELKAALRVVVDFKTWSGLRERGLDADRTARVAARMVEGAASPLSPGRASPPQAAPV